MKAEPLGYLFLIEAFDLDVLAPLCQTFCGEGAQRQERVAGATTTRFLPPRACHPATWQHQLDFALKQEGVNLEVLRAFFAKVPEQALADYVAARSVGIYRRRVWFFYEFLTGRELPLPALRQGNYGFVLDPEAYVARAREDSPRAKRQRLFNNLPGVADCCPMVRRTAKIRHEEADDLAAQVRKALNRYPAELLARANRWLHLKETKASFAIEHASPDRRREAAFLEILAQAGSEPLTKSLLLRLQNAIVDPRYREEDYRDDQVYVGETLRSGNELVHFVGARPEDVSGLMEGLLTVADRLTRGDTHPLVAAAAVAFLFVFIHPFNDGNGRLHRYLLQHILVAKGFIPGGTAFPLSAVLQRDPTRYDAMLETFSKRLMGRVDYALDPQGRMTVRNPTADYYRHIDLTPIVEALFDVARETLRKELIPELSHLMLWDDIQARFRAIVDMPDARAQHFARLALQNGGTLAKARRGDFPELTDDEVATLEQAIAQAQATLPVPAP